MLEMIATVEAKDLKVNDEILYDDHVCKIVEIRNIDDDLLVLKLKFGNFNFIEDFYELNEEVEKIIK